MAEESWNRDSDGTGCQQPEGLLLCTNNCGFFGSPATMNLCSKCYREVVLKQSSAFPSIAHGEKSLILDEKSLVSMAQGDLAAAAPLLSVVPPSTVDRRNDDLTSAVAACSSSAQILLHGDPAPAVSASPLQQKEQIHRQPNRCFTCRKRVGLLGFKCRCGDVFCASHRYSDKHDCSFDYKAAGRHAIAKANPLVKADKIQKI